MPRNCTIDYKVELISKYVRWDLLGYQKGQRLKDEDKKAHEMHIGFSLEEARRCKASTNPMFVNRFPLVQMEFTRADSYGYIKEVWGLETRASACTFCPTTSISTSDSTSRNNTLSWFKWTSCCGSRCRNRPWTLTSTSPGAESG